MRLVHWISMMFMFVRVSGSITRNWLWFLGELDCGARCCLCLTQQPPSNRSFLDLKGLPRWLNQSMWTCKHKNKWHSNALWFSWRWLKLLWRTGRTAKCEHTKFSCLDWKLIYRNALRFAAISLWQPSGRRVRHAFWTSCLRCGSRSKGLPTASETTFGDSRDACGKETATVKKSSSASVKLNLNNTRKRVRSKFKYWLLEVRTLLKWTTGSKSKRWTITKYSWNFVPWNRKP